MIELDQHDSAYLAVCKHYMAIYNTPVIKDDAAARSDVSSDLTQHNMMVIYLSK